ncbi:hypothetical protein A2U01_0068894, partial [Trifolium medium]|nr:hypothetical protein [Trifolium medium]
QPIYTYFTGNNKTEPEKKQTPRQVEQHHRKQKHHRKTEQPNLGPFEEIRPRSVTTTTTEEKPSNSGE